jgi:hypothetical protein
MYTNLYNKINMQRSLIVVLVLLLIGTFMLIVATQVHLSRLREVQVGMVNAAHRSYVEKEALCEAVNDQEHIIRRNLPMVKMSWTAKLREVCNE